MNKIKSKKENKKYFELLDIGNEYVWQIKTEIIESDLIFNRLELIYFEKIMDFTNIKYEIFEITCLGDSESKYIITFPSDLNIKKFQDFKDNIKEEKRTFKVNAKGELKSVKI